MTKKNLTLNATNLFVFTFIILLYKNIFVLFVPNMFLKMIFFIPFSLLLSLSVAKILNRSRFTKFELLILGFYMFFFILVIKSIVFMPSNIKINHVAIAFAQYFVPFSYILIITFLHMNFLKIFEKVFILSLPIFLFTVIEVFLPVEVISYFSNSIQDAKFGHHVDFSSGSYIFQDLSFYFIRTGSIFFEPLTLSIYSATILALVLTMQYNTKVLKFTTLASILFSIGKAGYLIMISTYIAKVLKKLSLYFFLILISSLILIFIFYFSHLTLKELKIVFYTAGPHIYGLIGGIVNATIHPYFGFGIGTGGFLVVQDFISTDQVSLFFPSSNIIRSNGNESAIGVMLYQTGYIFTSYFIFIFLSIAKKLYNHKLYYISGSVVGFICISLLTESAMATLLMVTPLVSSIGILRERKLI